jgi:hypothetical protein
MSAMVSEIDQERKQMSPMRKQMSPMREMKSIASFLEQMAKNRTTNRRFKSGIMTVDSDNFLGGLPVEFDFERKVVSVGDRESKLSLPLLELLYAPTSTVSGRAYDQETIRDYDRLTEHIDKKHAGRSHKYGLILNAQERQKKEERLRRDEEKRKQFDESLNIPMEGEGHTLIPQNVNQAAQRLNLLCGSVAAGNDHLEVKNEISMICDHLYKEKVLTKPEIKKLVTKYCF